MAIFTSGNSKNVMEAIKKAPFMGLYTVALLGRDGGFFKDMVDLPIIFESNLIAIIHEIPLSLIHIISELIAA